MAEVITILGVAASIVQIVDAVTKLKGICGTFKDASSELTDLVSEISISAKQLDRSKEYFEKASVLDVALVSECLEYLQQALLAVNTVSNKMQKTLNRGKTIGSMKFVWKAGQIQKLRQKLERAQRLMDRTERLIDRTQRDFASTEQSSQLQVIRFNSELVMQALEQVKNTAQSSLIQQPSLSPTTPQLTLESLKETSPVDKQLISNKRGCEIVLLRRLWSKTFKLVVNWRRSMISFTLRCYNIVPYNSDIFEAVANDDLDSVKRLFSTGQASPFDISPDGNTLLHRAALRCRSNVFRLLIGQGAEVDYTDNAGRSTLHWLVSGFLHTQWVISRDNSHKAAKTSVFEMTELSQELIPCDDQGIEKLEAVYTHPIGVSATRFILKGGLSNVSSAPLESRARMIMSTDHLDVIEDFLGPDLSPRQVFTYAQKFGISHRRHMGYFLYTVDEERCRWYDFIRELLDFDKTLNIEAFRSPIWCENSVVGVTVSCALDDELVMDLPRRWNQILQSFLTILMDFGADLEFLGQTEKHMFRQHGWSQVDHSYDRSCHFRWRMTGIETGAQPTDWKLWFALDDREYEWAGRFWHWIENPELYIPGAFVEDSW